MMFSGVRRERLHVFAILDSEVSVFTKVFSCVCTS
jgi:hypothetical protein